MAYPGNKKKNTGGGGSQKKTPANRSSSISGGLANEIRVKQKINLQRIASSAAKRRNVSGADEKLQTEKQNKTLMRALENPIQKDRVKNGEKVTENLETKRGKFVLMTGEDYEGSYHVHPGGSVMTEAVHLEGVSRYLVAKSDFKKNEQFYRTFYKRLSQVKPNI